MKQEKKRPLPKALLEKTFLNLKGVKKTPEKLPFCFLSLENPVQDYFKDVNEKKSLYRIVKIKK